MSAFTFDPRTGAYFYPNGEQVPRGVITQALEGVIGDSRDRLRVLAERFGRGDLDTLAWREAARAELKTGYGVAAQLAHGGQEGMTASARGWLGGQLRNQYGFLDQLALQVSVGDVDKTSDGFLARAQMYAEGIWSTYQQGKERVAREQGLDEEQNVLDQSADHCAGCLEADAAGWVPVGTLTPPGDRDCLSNCRCELDFRTAAEAAVEA